MGLGGLIGGLFGGSVAIRGGSALARGVPPTVYAGGGSGIAYGAKQFFTSPIIQGGQFGVGYTGGAYTGYGITNTWDPLGIHRPKYKPTKGNLGMPYGGYSYGRRYGSRYPRRRYRSRYGYRRRSYYGRRYY